MVEPNPLRVHLLRLRADGNIEEKQMAAALIALLDIAEADPFRKIPARWISTIMGRFIMREYDA